MEGSGREIQPNSPAFLSQESRPFQAGAQNIANDQCRSLSHSSAL